MRINFILAALPLFLSVSACGNAPYEPTDAETSIEQPLYGLGTIATKWENGVVPVCFVDTVNNASLRAEIPIILGLSWSNYANITFTGFGACSGANEVQVSFVSKTNGLTTGLGAGTRPVNLISDDARPNQTHFQYEVVHEFGHALGFAHEMKRPDNWLNGAALQCAPGATSDITQYSAQAGGLYLSATYDAASIMNYCDPAGNNTTTLSAGDIAGVQRTDAYGPANLSVVPNIITVTQGQRGPDIQLLSSWGADNFYVTGLPSGVTVLKGGVSGQIFTLLVDPQAALGTFVATAHGYGTRNGALEQDTALLQITVVAPVCIPKTCTFQSGMCGVQSDGCGGSISCGGCPGSDICDASGSCVCTSQQCHCELQGGTWDGSRCLGLACKTPACLCQQAGGDWHNHMCL